MKKLDTFITEKFKISSNINNLNDVLVYSAYTGDRDNPYENVFIKNTDDDIIDFVRYWWREELPHPRPEPPFTEEIRNDEKYESYFEELQEHIDEIKDTSKTISEYISNIYEYLEKQSFIFAGNMD